MEKAEQLFFAGPLALPIVRYESASYFADLRLAEFRAVDGPLESIVFDSDKGRLICRANGIIKCPGCGMSVIVGRENDIEKLRCVRCFDLLVPLF